MNKSINKKPMKPSQDMAKVVQVSERVALEDVRLLESRCQQKSITNIKGPLSFKINHSVNVVCPNEKNILLVIAHFDFQAIKEGEDKDLATINASFLLAYSISNKEGLTEDHYQQFANTNGIYNAWPYWREFVQNTIARMSLPPLTIPVFRLVRPRKIDNAQQALPKTAKRKPINANN
jgi:hypothetical protein